MTKYKKLYETYKTTLDEKEKLEKQVKVLEGQRRALVKELEEKDKREKEIGSVLSALSENLAKSLKTKNIINLKPEEKDAMYYMLEHFGRLISITNEK